MVELIVGGQKSGKTARAESLAAAWLAVSAGRRAVYLATAAAHDDEMVARIARHRTDRAAHVPSMHTVESGGADLAAEVERRLDPHTIVVVDCLTLWLTALVMPATGTDEPSFKPNPERAQVIRSLIAMISIAKDRRTSALVMVSNEIGLGVVPLGRSVRAFVDELGSLNRAVADVCDRVTLMVAGQPLVVKGAA